MSRPEVICDNCQKQVDMNDTSVYGSFKSGEVVVQYLRCPHCGKKYHMLTTNAELRRLIDERKGLELQLRMAHVKHFKAKTIRRYIKEVDKLKNKQNELADALKVIGIQLLNEV